MIDLLDENGPLNNHEIEQEVMSYVSSIEHGYLDPLEIHIKAKWFAKLFSEIAQVSLDGAIDEARKYTDGAFRGVKFEIKNVPDTYAFEEDIEYFRISESLKSRRAALKRAIAAKKKGGTIISADGEEIPPPPMKKAGGETISVKFS